MRHAEDIKKRLIELADGRVADFYTEKQTMNEGFSLAAKEGYGDIVKQALECRLISNVHFGKVLDKAVVENDVKAVSFLTVINGEESYYKGQERALKKAAEKGRLDIVKLLADNGMEVHKSKEALVLAVKYNNADILEFLIKKGADINTKVGYYDNFMIFFIYKDNIEMVKYLIEHGYDIYKGEATKWLNGCLPKAARHGNLDIFKYFYEETGKDDERCVEIKIYCAIQYGTLDVVKYVIKNVKSNEVKYIKKAIKNFSFWDDKDIEKIKCIVDSGIDISCYKKLVAYAVKNSNADTVQYLVKHGADVDIHETEYKNIMNYFICHEDMGMVKYLLKHGIGIEKKNKAFFNKLSEQKDTEILEYLLSNVKPDAKPYILRMYESAAEHGNSDAIEKLSELLSELSVHNQEPEHIEYYVRMLESAVEHGNMDVVKKLIEAGIHKHINIDGISSGDVLCVFALEAENSEELYAYFKEMQVVDWQQLLENALNYYCAYLKMKVEYNNRMKKIRK